ncbi:MAG: c-type cytochrome domain-containing protein [Bacteroidota bacterium]
MENQVSDFVLFLGRFHPLVVHLPIGFLILGVILGVTPKFESSKSAGLLLDLTLWLGALSAGLACIMGYMLSLEGGYDADTVGLHQWGGIALAVFAFALLAYRKKVKIRPFVQRVGFVILLLLLLYTGHLGGNLTHGSTYLFQYAPNAVRKMAGLPPKVEKIHKEITHIDSALVYEDIITPILDARCTSCHNTDKIKGDLLLTSFEGVMKGGESGASVIPGNSGESELFKRVTLPHDHEDFMPPEGKAPLSKEQVGFVEWWIDSGAKTNTTLVDLGASAEIRDKLEKYFKIGKYNTLLNDPIDPIDSSIMDDLSASGFHVAPLSENLNYLEVSAKIGEQITENQLKKLGKAKEHIVHLDLKNSGITDESLTHINNLPNLIRLRLDQNPITDAGISKLADLNNLEYLNLSFTKVSNASLDLVENYKNLKRLYHYDTGITVESN